LFEDDVEGRGEDEAAQPEIDLASADSGEEEKVED